MKGKKYGAHWAKNIEFLKKTLLEVRKLGG